ncbi:MAG TPA: quinone oxidoreductase [Holophagaceae bacterium]|nr:quinone oxidoreductase [Holophagaceae bacterium]
MKALVFERFGGPEVLEYREVPDPEPRKGFAIVRTQAIGLNFADIYRRKGNYTLAGNPPYIAGYEAAGIIESVSDKEFKAGQRVAFADNPFANAELVSVRLDKLIPLPDDIPADIAASLLLQGLTAQYLVRDSHPLQAGEDALIHAAAGGVGLLLTQMAKLLGARVLGLTSTRDKADMAVAAGADAVALYSGNWVDAAKAFSRTGKGVDVAYDSVGTTLQDSFKAVRHGGHVVFFGMAGGDPAPVDPRMLMDSSKSLTGGDLWNVLTSGDERRRRAAELFDWVRKGKLKIHVAARCPLSEGARAHTFLESRNSSGKVLLIP